ncbi:MAG: SusD/RagB family nutrient-binding outer membrane lipoprotein [Fermentimonas sp.]|nr:SusD/RagB family nutrient-binding outer membrane lipoprotein [Fermentimonas sp.]
MKKNIYIAILLGILGISISCSEDIMDDINKNVNDPENMSSRLILTDMMTSTAFSVTGSDLAFYASVYIEHNAGIYNQSYNAEIRSNEPTSSTTYNNSWNTLYDNLSNLKTVIEKCSEGGDEEGNFYNLGIAQILSAYNLAVLTDLMGDVPWTEALQPGIVFTPQLDSQEDIYGVIFKFLDDGIANLSEDSEFPLLGGQDFIYGGNAASIAKWIKFGYGLKARYTMRLSHKSPNYAEVITLANQSFANKADEAKFVYNGTSTISPFYKFYTDRDYFGASQSLNDKLLERNDPRDEVFFKPNEDLDEIEFAINGSPAQVQGRYGLSAITNSTAPTYLLSYHEIEFLKAEAYARQGAGTLTQAKDALKKAVTAALTKSNIGLTTAEANEHFDTRIAGRLTTPEATLSEIMVQKYLAFYEEEAIEAYNDYRRLKAMGNNFIQLKNPLNSDKFPERFTYGASDVTTNENIRDAYGDGTYVYTEKVWWAGGTR